MLFFGHKFLKSDNFYHINDIESIEKTPNNSLLYIEFDEKNLDIIEHAKENDLTFALEIKNVTQLMYASTLEAKYIIVEQKLAKTAQTIAENYLFDAKILVNIESEQEIEELALLGVDGVLFSNAIIKISF